MLKCLSSIVFLSISLIANSALAQQEILSEQELRLISWVDKNQDQILSELKSHVEINTGTANIEGLNQYRDLLSADLEALGFITETHSSSDIDVLSCKGGSIQIADHLVAKRAGSAKNRVLMNGHMDTVFSKEDEFQTLSIADDGVLKGPGVADMKGGIVIMINALRALHAQGLLDDTNLTVLFNSDEEIGSLGSRQLIEELARQHDLGLVFEGSSNNLATRARKGWGQVRLRVTGRESHAGGAHEEGVSATLELAHKVIEIEKLTDYSRKVTVNTGVFSGGEKRNTVPGCADAYIDMRFPSLEAGKQLEQSVKRIAASKPMVENAKYPDLPIVESWAVLHRPVKPENTKVDEIIAQAMALSALIGEPIIGTRYSGGGTDGSIAQGVGLPTMDSLGIDGKGAHSSREESTVRSLIARTKLAAVLLARQLHQ
jgi:glutamate carboxypeptidase